MEQLAKSTDSKKKTFQFYASRWLDGIILDVKETSIIKYRNIINSYLLPHFGRSLVSKIDRVRIGAFASLLLAAGGAKGHPGASAPAEAGEQRPRRGKAGPFQEGLPQV